MYLQLTYLQVMCSYNPEKMYMQLTWMCKCIISVTIIKKMHSIKYRKQGYFTLVINSNFVRYELGWIGLNWVELGWIWLIPQTETLICLVMTYWFLQETVYLTLIWSKIGFVRHQHCQISGGGQGGKYRE